MTWEDIGCWGDTGYTHTASSMSIAVVLIANRESDREREGINSAKESEAASGQVEASHRHDCDRFNGVLGKWCVHKTGQ